MKTRMCNSLALVKQQFLKNWMKGLQTYTNFKNEMTVLERKKAIKLSADVAMASTRNGSTRWSRALLADASQAGATTRTLVEQIVGSRGAGKNRENGSMIACNMGKKILRRSHIAKRRRVRARGVVPRTKASSIAKRLVKNRTRVLKRLVPGGEGLDEVSLIKETLDYVVSLRVQVDVMRCLANFSERNVCQTLNN